MIKRLPCLSITTATLIFYTGLGHTSDAATSYSIDDESLVWGPCPEFFPSGCQIAVLHGACIEAS